MGMFQVGRRMLEEKKDTATLQGTDVLRIDSRLTISGTRRPDRKRGNDQTHRRGGRKWCIQHVFDLLLCAPFRGLAVEWAPFIYILCMHASARSYRSLACFPFTVWFRRQVKQSLRCRSPPRTCWDRPQASAHFTCDWRSSL